MDQFFSTRVDRNRFSRQGKERWPALLLVVVLTGLAGWAVTFLLNRSTSLFISGLILCGLILLGVKYPEVSVAILYVGMFVWQFLPEGEGLSGYRVPITLAWLVFAYLLHAFVVDRRGFRIAFTNVELRMVAFLAYAAVSLSWSHNQPYGIWKLTLFFGQSLFTAWFLRCFYVLRPFRLPLLMQAVATVSILPLVAVIWVFLSLGGIENLVPGRIYQEGREMFDTMFTVYGASDALMIGSLCSTYFFLRTETKGAKWLWGFVVLAELWGMLLLGQRGPFLITFICGAILYWYLSGSAKKSKITRLIIVLLILGVGIWSQLTFNVRSALTFLRDDWSLSNRIVAFEVALLAFADNPLIGVGTGNYIKYSTMYAYKYLGSPGLLGSRLYTDVARSFPHNIFLEVLAENGLIGFALWLAVFWSVTRLIFKALNSKTSPFYGAFSLASVWVIARILVVIFSGDLATLAWGAPLAIISIAGISGRRPRGGTPP